MQWRALLALAILLASPGFLLHRSGGGATASGGTMIALTRVFNNPGGSGTGTPAFWMIGQPFKNTYSDPAGSEITVDELPSGNIITCTLGGTSVPCSLINRKAAADGSVKWGQLLVDFSGVSIGAGGSKTLQLTATTGTWPTCASGCLTNAAWNGLGDIATLSSVSAGVGTGATLNGSGTWNAKFDGNAITNVITTIGNSPQGLVVKVLANLWDTTSLAVSSASWATGTETFTLTSAATGSELFVGNDSVILNGAGGQLAMCTGIVVPGDNKTNFTCATGSNPGTVTSISAVHRNMVVVMYYWATCTNSCASQVQGPIESWGPFVENVLIWPKTSGSYGNSTNTSFNYSLAYDRGATKIRDCATAAAYCGLLTGGYAIGTATRADAQGDWWVIGTGTAGDPGIYVTQDYTQVVATRKVPPFKNNITAYTGNGADLILQVANGTSRSGNTLTVDAEYALFGPQNHNGGPLCGTSYPQPVQFVALGSLTGPSLGVVYWAADQATNNTINFYDNLTDALANGATGIITLGGTATGSQVEIAEAPGAAGQYCYFSMGAVATRPDLSVPTEWGAAYLVGGSTNNTNGTQQAWQYLGRVMAYNMSGIHLDAINGVAEGGQYEIVNLLNTAVGGMTAHSISSYGVSCNSSGCHFDINNGAQPSGGYGAWQWQGSANQHITNGAFIPWLMEGSPYLADQLVMQADGQVTIGPASKNWVVNGTTYYGTFVCNGDGYAFRQNAWSTRDVAEGAFAARNGSDEETYLYAVLTQNMLECQAQQTYFGTNYTNIGFSYWPVGTTSQNTHVEMFMAAYHAETTPWAAILDGDQVNAGGYTLFNLSAFEYQWLGYFFNGAGCPYWANVYGFGPATSGWNGALPGVFVSSLSEMGLQQGAGDQANFISTQSPTIYLAAVSPWVLAAKDKVRFADYTTDGSSYGSQTTVPPTGFTVGTDYFVQSPAVNANVQNVTGNTTASSGTISSISSMTNIAVGMLVTQNDQGQSAGIPFPSFVTSVNGGASSVTIASGAGTLPSGTVTGATLVFTGVPSFQASTDLAGSNIVTFSTSAGTVYNYFIPGPNTACPGSGMAGSHNFSDSYLTYETAGLAMMAEINVTGAATAYTNAFARYGGASTDGNGTSMFWFAPP